MALYTSNIPIQTALVRFTSVTQHGVSAMPLDAEAKDDPAGIARDCQAAADASQLPVVFTCEVHGSGRLMHTSRHTFNPVKPCP